MTLVSILDLLPIHCFFLKFLTKGVEIVKISFIHSQYHTTFSYCTFPVPIQKREWDRMNYLDRLFKSKFVNQLITFKTSTPDSKDFSLSISFTSWIFKVFGRYLEK